MRLGRGGRPPAVAGVILVGPFVRDMGSPTQQRIYRVLFRAVLTHPWGLTFWMRYWKSLFPSRKPEDFDEYAETLRSNLAEPERFSALRRMMLGPSRREIEARLACVEAPALVLMGTMDRDFKDPAAEGRLVAERIRGELALLECAGHYPHVEFPDPTAARIVDFARRRLNVDMLGAPSERG